MKALIATVLGVVLFLGLYWFDPDRERFPLSWKGLVIFAAIGIAAAFLEYWVEWHKSGDKRDFWQWFKDKLDS